MASNAASKESNVLLLTTAALALAGLSVLASTVSVVAWSRASTALVDPSNSPDGKSRRSKSRSAKGGTSTGAEGKTYKRITQYWSESLRTWETRTPDSDGSEATAGELFVVKERKASDPEYHDQLLVEVKSPFLALILRKIMKDSDDVCSEEPIVNARDIFVRRRILLELGLELSDHQTGTAATGRDPQEAIFAPSVGVPVSNSADSRYASDPSTADDDDEPSLIALLDSNPATNKAAPDTAERVSKAFDHAGELYKWLVEEYKTTEQKLRHLLPNRISWALLWCIFREGMRAVVWHETSGEKLGIKVTSAYYAVSSHDGPYFGVRGHYIQYNGTGYSKMHASVRILEFKGVQEITALDVCPMTDEDFRKLQERGVAAKKLVGVHHMLHRGSMFQITGWGTTRQIVRRKADGRTMIDTCSFLRMNPGNEIVLELNYCCSRGGQKTIADSDLWRLPPTVLGFSLSLKEWGEFMVTQFVDIVFDDLAYDHLVLEADTKDLVKALVDNQSTDGADPSVSDVISGKGGGLICVLHGRPGTGKTLTAESVAERMRRPLFTVSSCSLGLEAGDVESNLRDALELAHLWKACILIDEADVFLEERGAHETGRNALVAVFLRLLEYHESVMFLTTNRIRSFDPAFISRFNVCIRYPPLDAPKRGVIWRKFLAKAYTQVASTQSKALPPAPSSPSRAGTNDSTRQMSFDTIKSSASSDTDATVVGAPAEPKDEEKKVVERVGEWVTEELLAELSRHPLNGMSSLAFAARTVVLTGKLSSGRSIKNVVRTGQALARSANEPLGSKHLKAVIKTAQTFKRDLEEDHFWNDEGSERIDMSPLFN